MDLALTIAFIIGATSSLGWNWSKMLCVIINTWLCWYTRTGNFIFFVNSTLFTIASAKFFVTPTQRHSRSILQRRKNVLVWYSNLWHLFCSKDASHSLRSCKCVTGGGIHSLYHFGFKRHILPYYVTLTTIVQGNTVETLWVAYPCTNQAELMVWSSVTNQKSYIPYTLLCQAWFSHWKGNFMNLLLLL